MLDTDKELLNNFLRQYFGSNRSTNVQEIMDSLKETEPALAAKLKKASKHLGFKTYLTKYFLRDFLNEGWLTVTNQSIQVKLSLSRCSYCFSAIENVYLIDIELNRYCGRNCIDKLPHYFKTYESGLETYGNLFDHFSMWFPLCQELTTTSFNSLTSKDAKVLSSTIDNYLDSEYWDNFLLPHTSQSCIDSEIYRMLTLLREQARKLQKLANDFEQKEGNSTLYSQCAQPVDARYVVNQRGQYFCSEECHQIYYKQQPDKFKEADDDHPYYFDYLSIRQVFLHWFDWKSILQEMSQASPYPNAYAQWNADDCIDELDCIICEYKDYIQTEGDDGIFSREIYNYTLKLQQIQQQILLWRPERQIYHGLYCYEDKPGLAEKLLEEAAAAKGPMVVQNLVHHSHPFHTNFDYVFETDQEQNEMLTLLLPYFERNQLDLTAYDAHLCDGGCNDYLDSSDSLYWHHGWFYCETCLDLEDVGEMDLSRLQRLLAYYDHHDEDLHKLIHDKQGDYDRYKKWIRRACRVHQIDIPAWAVD
ncbi:MAG: hypothetical protein K0R57_2546 [Paenibacillaceae bacterium]|nr:hypothetical protein [Paenibacillaceae bacterium]